MLSFFRTNQLAFNLFLIFYILLLRGSTFFNTGKDWVPESKGVLSDWVYGLFDYSGTAAALLSIFLVFFQAILINIVVARFRMATEITLFPGLLYILVASAIPDFLHLSPILLANTFFIAALLEMYKIYRNKAYYGNIFNIGFWLGTASLFYFSEMIFILWMLFGISILRTFKPAEFLISIIGFWIPYFLLGVYYFWNDRLSEFMNNQFAENIGFLDFAVPFNWQTYLSLGLFGLLTIFTLLNANSYFFKKNIQVQKNITLLYWALLFGLSSVFIQANITLSHLLILAVPLAIFLSFTFLKIKSTTAEAIHLLFVIAVLVFQIKGWGA